MAQIVHIAVENPDELLNAGAYGAGAVLRLQISATEAGVFADVSGTGSTPTIALVAGTRAYTGYDPTGATASWYRYRVENAGATRLGDYSAAFQVGATDGGIVSLGRVKMRLGGTDTTNDALLLSYIAEAGQDLQSITGRRFVRMPISGTTTFLFDVEYGTRRLRVPEGIAAATVLEVATVSQPETGGTFTTVSTADWMLRPVAHQRLAGWPATEVVITDNPSGAVPQFYPGVNTVRLTGAIGFTAAPYDVVDIATNAIIRRFVAKGSGVAQSVGSDAMGGAQLLRWISPEERERLEWYRHVGI